VADEAVIHTHTDCKLVAPAVSEYLSVKFWLSPDPEFGITEATVAFVVVKDQTAELLVPEEFLATTIQ
jgi:hypothetical protein